MADERARIRMTGDELRAFLEEGRTLQVATINPDGTPHLTALYYAVEPDGSVAFWTYARSRKITNLRRDPRLGCLVETGQAYFDLRGAQLNGEAELIQDIPTLVDFGRRLWPRYFGPVDERAEQSIARTATKRVLVRVRADHVVTWDHSKLPHAAQGAS